MSEGQLAMNLGLDQVERNNIEWIETMRGFAREHSKHHGKVSADDLRKWEATIGKPISSNAWGAIFRNRNNELGFWVRVGYKQSKIRSRKNGIIRVWTWVEGDSRG